jgi:hypothetical protein
MKYTASQQTLGWFKDRYLEGNLEIRPPYQRRPVWTTRQKSNLIESILLGLPVPEIYVQVVTDEAGDTTYAVVDGQQRVRAMLQFIGVDKDESEEEDNGFTLEELPEDSKWRNVDFEDLDPGQKRRFFGHQLAVRLLEDSTDEEVRDLFRRLNKYLTKLNDQELRNATYSGPFIALVEQLADDEFWAENGIVSAALIRRMKDLEFVSELLIGILDGPQGGAAKVIDEYYLQFEHFAEEFPQQKILKRRYAKTLNLIKALFPDIRKLRWKNRTDFYSLFVVVAELLSSNELPTSQYSAFKKTLAAFAGEVEERISDDDADVSEDAAAYARAAVKGSSERSRRMDRHNALMDSIKRYFRPAVKTAR